MICTVNLCKVHQSKRIQGNGPYVPRMTSAEFVSGLYFVTNLLSLTVLRLVVVEVVVDAGEP